MKNLSRWLGAVLGSVFLVSACRPAGETGKPEGIIGGIGLTRITVYDQRPAPDGLQSGAPYMRAVTDEGFYVISGTGRIELHDVHNGFRSVNLSPGRYVQIPPCTLHRLIGTDHLVVLGVTGSAGPAARNDARIYFGQAVDENPVEFVRLTGLAEAEGLEGALKRRDEAVRAYTLFLELWKFDKVAYYRELERFAGVHLKTAAAKRNEFDGKAGSAAWTARYRARLKNLPLNRDEMPPAFYFPPEEEIPGLSGLLLPVTNLEKIK
ncbi:MAG: cupin domain-containing protein [Candidatus Aminicenantes bacterium]|nr:cupin domain-containing protein [Candidatus Aminicenantes bacterium]